MPLFNYTRNILHTQLLFVFLLLTESSFALPQEVQTGLDQYSATGFIENMGQLANMEGDAAQEVLFYTSFPQTDLFITEDGLTILFQLPNPTLTELTGKKQYDWERIDITLKNADISKENAITQLQHPAPLFFYNTLVPEGVSTFGYDEIVFHDVYPGIDWQILFDDASGFKYNFIVDPNTNPEVIELTYATASMIELTDIGQIKMMSLLGAMYESAPITFTTADHTPITSQFELTPIDANLVAVDFLLGEYDHSQSITIDPELHWCTYYGGNKEECFNSVTSDIDGNLIAVGWTDSPAFPTLTCGTYFQGTLAALEDAMIVKFSSEEERIWSTFYGGNKEDWAYSVTTDASNNIFVSGETVSGSFPVYNAGTFYQAALNGDEDVFILKFNAAGTRLWATFYGGDKKEGGYGITTDPSGNIFVTGYTESTDFPKLNAGTFYQAALGGNEDAFILKFNNAGTRIWATYYGGSLYDVGNAICSDAAGNVFITGDTRSSNFPVYNAGTYYQGTMAGDTDTYVIKFANTGARLWATYYGGADADYGNSIITDNYDNIYLAGWTRSADFPVMDKGNFYQSVLGGLSDAHIVQFDNSGNRMWSTYFGGAAIENVYKWDILTSDFCGNIYLAITTFSSDMPVYNAGCSSYYDATYEAYGDIFLVRFTDDALITWATYYGYDNEELDACIGISQLDGKSLYMTGLYNEYDPGAAVPLVNPGGTAYYDGTHNGDNEAFIGKFEAVPLSIATENSNVCYCLDTAVALPDCGVAPYDYLWSDGQTTAVAIDLCPAAYTVTVTDADCNIMIASIEIICALPVHVVSFEGAYINNSIELNWTAFDEDEIEHYVLQKSMDGSTFTTIASINPMHQSNINYIFIDQQVQAGVNYYQLFSEDKNGHLKAEGMIAVTALSTASELFVQYNGNNDLHLEYFSNFENTQSLIITNTTGQTIYSNTIDIIKGMNTINIQLPAIPEGMYYVFIAAPGEVISGAFLQMGR
jgi:hypothetical protein